MQSDLPANGALSNKKNVWKVFDSIASSYDFTNRVLSVGQDVLWRKKVARYLPKGNDLCLLDLATGTGDLLFSLVATNRIKKAVGVDLAEGMLEIAKKKPGGSSSRVSFQKGDACSLTFEENSFDAASIAFGIRNVGSVSGCLRQMFRVLRPGGRAIILEFSLPRSSLVKAFYLTYFRYILPRLGGMISGDYHAYKYLNESVEDFPYGEKFVQLMCDADFSNINTCSLSLGVATIYCGEKA